MRIGIDISQIVHEGTGVGEYVKKVVSALLEVDKKNEYVLFGSSLRKRNIFFQYFNTLGYLRTKIKLVVLPVPPFLLEILWNRFHIVPIEWLIGDVDVFWSSDWTQPPLARSKGVTTIHDVSFLRFPETFPKTLVEVQKRRLVWAKKECTHFLCDSEATAKDAKNLLGIVNATIVYPGL